MSALRDTTVSTSAAPSTNYGAIWNMSFGFLGIQFGWGLQMANMSAIYEYLGASADMIPMLWLAAPLTGLIIQPIIGHLSDRTWSPRFGRRRRCAERRAVGHDRPRVRSIRSRARESERHRCRRREIGSLECGGRIVCCLGCILGLFSTSRNIRH